MDSVLQPTTEVMARPGKGTSTATSSTEPFDWTAVYAAFRSGDADFWLTTVNTDGHPHVVPVLAAWDGASCFVATKATARKTRDLQATGRCVLASGIDRTHVVIEATARQVVDAVTLQRASAAFATVYDWPTTVVGEEIDAPYAAPTSGGPPFQIWEIIPTKAFGFPKDGESAAPTRWQF